MQVFLCSARAVRDTMCHHHHGHGGEQPVPTDEHHGRELRQAPRGRLEDSSSDPGDGSSPQRASQNKNQSSVHYEQSLGWFLSISFIVSCHALQ